MSRRISLDKAAKLVTARLGLRYGISADRAGKGQGYAIVFLSWLDFFTCSEQPIVRARSLIDLLRSKFPDLRGKHSPPCPRWEPGNYFKQQYIGPECSCND